MAEFVITIDGPAGSGKSTIAALLAKKLGAGFLDTGAMYRAVTWAAMQTGANLEDQQELLKVLQQQNFAFTSRAGKMFVSLNDIDVTGYLRFPEVTANAKYIASAAKVREKLVQMQRQFASRYQKIVSEGRDQGTVAFPDANLKIYLVAEAAERAMRRQADLRLAGVEENLEKIERDIIERDKSDAAREAGPMKPADDAVIVDTTKLTIEQVIEKLVGMVKDKCLK